MTKKEKRPPLNYRIKKLFDIDKFLENKRNRIILLISFFLIAVLFYVYVSTFFIHRVYADNELYLDMAKSFFRDKTFLYGNMDSPYSDYPLMPAILSFAYYFYSPEAISMIMLFIGNVIMASSVFPIYLLSKEIGLNHKKSFIVVFLSIISGYMQYSLYVSLETLFFTLSLWAMYFIIKEIKSPKPSINSAVLSVFFALLFFTKNLGILLPFAYFAFFGISWLISGFKKEKEKFKNEFLKLLTTGLVFILLVLVFTYMLNLTRPAQAVSNGHLLHMISFITQFFEKGIDGVLHFLQGYVFYVFFFFISVLVLPLVFFLSNKVKDKPAEKFRIFTIFSVLIFITVIILLIHIKEEPMDKINPRIHIRYLFTFFPVIYAYMFLPKESVKFNKWIAIACGAFLIAYPLLGGKIATFRFIYDSNMLLFLLRGIGFSRSKLIVLAGISLIVFLAFILTKFSLKRTFVYLFIIASTMNLFNFLSLGNTKIFDDLEYIPLAREIENIPGETVMVNDRELVLGPNLVFYTEKVLDKITSNYFFEQLVAGSGRLVMAETIKPLYHYATLYNYENPEEAIHYLDGACSILIPIKTIISPKNAELEYTSDEFKLYSLEDGSLETDFIGSYSLEYDDILSTTTISLDLAVFNPELDTLSFILNDREWTSNNIVKIYNAAGELIYQENISDGEEISFVLPESADGRYKLVIVLSGEFISDEFADLFEVSDEEN